MWRFCAEAAFINYPKPRIQSRIRRLGATCDPLHCLAPIKHHRRVSSHSYSNTHPVALALSDSQCRTIYALSTPPGKAGIAVVRVSGPEAFHVWNRMVRTSKGHAAQGKSNPDFWRMHRCRVVHPENGETLDDGLAVLFQGLCVSNTPTNV